MLELIVLNRILVKSYEEIKNARRCEGDTKDSVYIVDNTAKTRKYIYEWTSRYQSKR